MTSPDQRRSPRIDVRHRLSGYIVSLDRPAVVCDLSLGGFAVETEAEIPDGVYIVRLREGDRWSVTVTAASRHRRAKDGAGGKRHITGFEYEDQNPDTQQTIRVLFERLAAEENGE
jgi:PilZ domain-containing protein